MNNIDTPTQPESDVGAPGVLALPLATIASVTLAACGGGNGDEGPSAATSSSAVSDQSGLAVSTTLSDRDAWRFLNQATMGPTAQDIANVKRMSRASWLDAQFSLPKSDFTAEYTRYWNELLAVNRAKLRDSLQRELTSAELQQFLNDDFPSYIWTISSWWKAAIGGKDQLRQRVAFALSEIVVTSFQNQDLLERPKMMSGWLDLLQKHAFGNYRTFIYDVVRSPAMGYYLTHLQNIKPNDSGQRPDQNFARELIQLFTVGLVKLNDYGQVETDNDVATPASKTAATDIKLLSHVFVGLAFDGTDRTYGYLDRPDFFLGRSSDAYVNPMKLFNEEACTQAMVTKSLGLPDDAQLKLLETDFRITDGNLDKTINDALDIIFSHTNLAPFVSKQMIQRLVTSNPTAAYVYRVATAFRSSKYDMKTLIRAILLDKEALTAPTSADYGKIREPLLRISHLIRATTDGKVVSPTNPNTRIPTAGYHDDTTSVPINRDRPGRALSQAPLSAVNVFNFFSPSYQANGSFTAKNRMVAPELQITTETSVATYVNAVMDILFYGFFDGAASHLDIDVSPIAALASTTSMVNRISDMLMGGSMSAELKAYLVTTMNAETAMSASDKARLGIWMTMVSPEYIVQK
jgi:uncharacterized protein (DUF1800 family)